jgi:hypothetical protein
MSNSSATAVTVSYQIDMLRERVHIAVLRGLEEMLVMPVDAT